MMVRSVFSMLFLWCRCEVCEGERVPLIPGRAARACVQRLVDAGHGGPVLRTSEKVALAVVSIFLGGALYAALIGTLHVCVLLFPGASAASPPAVRQSQIASAEAAGGPTYRGTR